MSIEVPDGWLVWTRDTAPDEKQLKGKDMNSAALQKEMNSGPTYLIALDPEGLCEIVVNAGSNDEIKAIGNLKDRSEMQIAGYEMGYYGNMEATGSIILSKTRYEHSQALFIVVDYIKEMKFARDYTTVINGQCINIVLRNFNGILTENQLDILSEVVDSVLFSEVQALPDISLTAPASTLDIKELGITVDVPEGWLTFTRDVSEDTLGLVALATTAEVMRQNMKATESYGLLYNPKLEADITFMLVPGAKEAGFSDAGDWTEKEVAAVLATAEQQIGLVDGIESIKSGTYQQNGIHYFVFECRVEVGIKRYLRYYLTEWEDNALVIMVNDYSGEIRDSVAGDFDAVVRSLRPLGAKLPESSDEQGESAAEPTKSVASAAVGKEDTKGYWAAGLVILIIIRIIVYGVRKKTHRSGE